MLISLKAFQQTLLPFRHVDFKNRTFCQLAHTVDAADYVLLPLYAMGLDTLRNLCLLLLRQRQRFIYLIMAATHFFVNNLSRLHINSSFAPHSIISVEMRSNRFNTRKHKGLHRSFSVLSRDHITCFRVNSQMNFSAILFIF